MNEQNLETSNLNTLVDGLKQMATEPCFQAITILFGSQEIDGLDSRLYGITQFFIFIQR